MVDRSDIIATWITADTPVRPIDNILGSIGDAARRVPVQYSIDLLWSYSTDVGVGNHHLPVVCDRYATGIQDSRRARYRIETKADFPLGVDGGVADCEAASSTGNGDVMEDDDTIAEAR